jgi:hypothetical protein
VVVIAALQGAAIDSFRETMTAVTTDGTRPGRHSQCKKSQFTFPVNTRGIEEPNSATNDRRAHGETLIAASSGGASTPQNKETFRWPF